jgi:hypothetical protein
MTTANWILHPANPSSPVHLALQQAARPAPAASSPGADPDLGFVLICGSLLISGAALLWLLLWVLRR